MTTHRMLPLYEAKMIHHYDHRWATYERDGTIRDVTPEEKADPNFFALPRYWVREEVVADRLEGRWNRDWLLGWRDICRSTDERTCIATINGANASPEGGTLLAFCDPPESALMLLANFNSFAFDFVARQKVGGTHLKYFTMRQLPMLHPSSASYTPPWSSEPLGQWINERVLDLLVDNTEMVPLAGDFNYKPTAGQPWNPERRELVRAELDAAFFYLYGMNREEVEYVLDTFGGVRNKDLARFGEYRTKRLILERFDQMLATTSIRPAEADPTSQGSGCRQ